MPVVGGRDENGVDVGAGHSSRKSASAASRCIRPISVARRNDARRGLGRLAAIGGTLSPGIIAIVQRCDIADGHHLHVRQAEKLPQIVEALAPESDQAHRHPLVGAGAAAARQSQCACGEQ